MKKYNTGFTLIELLVVIAIIGILATVVIASLGTARAKAFDAKVQGQLSSMRAAAEEYYSTNGNYGGATNCTTGGMGLDTASGFANLVAAANYGGTAPTCTTDSATAATKWSAYHLLSDNSTPFCVDSTGQSKKEASTWTAPTGGNPCP